MLSRTETRGYVLCLATLSEYNKTFLYCDAALSQGLQSLLALQRTLSNNVYCRIGRLASTALQSRRLSRWSFAVAARPSEVYVFNFEGVLCEADGSQVYADAQQLQAFEAPFYITSSLSQAEIGGRLQSAGISIPPDSPQLFTGLNPGQTAEILKQISQRPVVKDTGARLNFLSSSVDAVKAAKSAMSHGLRLYFAAWSQEGRSGRGEFEGDDRVVVLEQKQFNELLSWGLLMGVDDGCGDDN